MSGALHFVFLQGMPSPFFRKIARLLHAKGCRVTGVNLCTGDWLNWRGPRSVNYRGSYAGWPDFIEGFFRKEAVTDIVLLGEQRRYHREAVAIARRLGIRVTVTDFGYLRPDWITLERDGMSGNSSFPRDVAVLRDMAAAVPVPDFSRVYTDSFWAMAFRDMLYSFSNVFAGYFYPRYKSSIARPHPLVYFPAMGLRLLMARRNAADGTRRFNALLAEKPRYFIFPLQLDFDFQLVAYSPFGNMDKAIRFVLDSFAAAAPPDTRLFIKSHPFDPYLKNWRRRIDAQARALGISGRVAYFDGGDLDEMTRHASGMVTVNSTSGLRALQLGCPVKVLGQAIFDMPGMTFQGALPEFWASPAKPEMENVGAFIRAAAGTIQLRGVFFTEPGVSDAAAAAAERLYAGEVGKGVIRHNAAGDT